MEDLQTISDESPPRQGEFRLQLPTFEGPLDLLLHLINKHELDVLDLPIAFVTERYLQYLKLLQELDLDVAAEYLLMAATLAHIKSKMLLPRAPNGQADDAAQDEAADPRLELIRRLLEYQKYKAVAEHLGSLPLAGRDVFPRGLDAHETQEPAPLAELGLFRLLDAFHAILDRAKGRIAFEITTERITIHERITQVVELLRERRSCAFEELFEGDFTRYDVVVTFLALLEMSKMRIVRIYQADHTSPIHLQFALLDASAPSVPPAANDRQPYAEDVELAAEDGAGSLNEA
jgi:segregation and condensation protein A